jgi:N6-L-threonylcarbamoyladenine synthase
MSTLKGGIRKLNQAPIYVKGFRLFDAVKAKGKEWYILGRRLKGSFVLRNLQGDTLEITPSKIQLIYRQNQFISNQFTVFLS